VSLLTQALTLERSAGPFPGPPSGHYTLSRALAQGGVRFLLTALSLAKREKENKTETSPTIKWEKEDENAKKETGKQENKKKRPKRNDKKNPNLGTSEGHHL
jgi:hypothetical protein